MGDPFPRGHGQTLYFRPRERIAHLDPGLGRGGIAAMERSLGMVNARWRRIAMAVLAFMAAGCRSDELDKGQACLALGDYPMAQRFFAHAVESDPRGYAARLGLGQALLQKAYAENDSAAFAG